MVNFINGHYLSEKKQKKHTYYNLQTSNKGKLCQRKLLSVDKSFIIFFGEVLPVLPATIMINVLLSCLSLYFISIFCFCSCKAQKKGMFLFPRLFFHFFS